MATDEAVEKEDPGAAKEPEDKDDVEGLRFLQRPEDDKPDPGKPDPVESRR